MTFQKDFHLKNFLSTYQNNHLNIMNNRAFIHLIFLSKVQYFENFF